MEEEKESGFFQFRPEKISKVLDEALWDQDKRFRDLNWKFFDDHHFILKNSFLT